MNLFVDGKFKSHAGQELLWKIECDALSASDWDCIAKMVADKFKFREVHGIPDGGLMFARALKKYEVQFSRRILIVDDVYTTGQSMNEKLAEMGRKENGLGISGIVLFARNDTPNWIMPLFELNSFFWD